MKEIKYVGLKFSDWNGYNAIYLLEVEMFASQSTHLPLLKYFNCCVLFLYCMVVCILWCTQNEGEICFPICIEDHWKKIK